MNLFYQHFCMNIIKNIIFQDSIRKLVKEAENISRVKISTLLIKDILNANTPEQADDLIRKIAGK